MPGVAALYDYEERLRLPREAQAHSVGLTELPDSMALPLRIPATVEPAMVLDSIPEHSMHNADVRLYNNLDRLSNLPEQAPAIEGLRGRLLQRRYQKARYAAAVGVRSYATIWRDARSVGVQPESLPHILEPGKAYDRRMVLGEPTVRTNVWSFMPSPEEHEKEQRSLAAAGLQGLRRAHAWTPLRPVTPHELKAHRRMTKLHDHRAEAVTRIATIKAFHGQVRPESSAWPPVEPAASEFYDHTYKTRRTSMPYNPQDRKSERDADKLIHKHQHGLHHAHHEFVKVAESRDRPGKRAMKQTEKAFQKAEKILAIPAKRADIKRRREERDEQERQRNAQWQAERVVKKAERSRLREERDEQERQRNAQWNAERSARKAERTRLREERDQRERDMNEQRRQERTTRKQQKNQTPPTPDDGKEVSLDDLL